MADGEQPKIIVDDDWKSQAQAEKAKLAEEAKAEEAPAGGMPETLGFTDIVRMFASQALMYMGAIPDPQTGKAVVALDIAKMNIDLLGILEEKTKGNLNEEEQSLLDEAVVALRSQFVEITRLVGQAQAEGRIGADGTIRDPGGAAPGSPAPGSPAPGTPDLGV